MFDHNSAGTKARNSPEEELETAVGVAESTDERGILFERIPFEAKPGTGVTRSWLV